MITGKVKKTWKASHYQKLHYQLGNAGKPFERIGASKKIMELYKDQAGAFICTDVPNIFMNIANQFGLSNTVVALTKMKVGQILPWHVDRCKTYISKNNIKDKTKIARIIVFLEDSKPGHQLWIEDQLCTGEAGSCFGWMFGTKHMAANLGEQDRYTLQITGVRD